MQLPSRTICVRVGHWWRRGSADRIGQRAQFADVVVRDEDAVGATGEDEHARVVIIRQRIDQRE
jgi:hypothetical protein